MAQYIQVGNDLVEFPDNMSDDQIANVLKGQAQPQSKQAPEQKFSGFLMGLKDPISGGAQLLEKALPKSLVNRINMVNNELAKYGLVSPVGAGGVTEQVAKEQQAYQAQRQAQGEGENIDFSRVAGNVLSPANLAVGGVAGSLVTAPARQAAVVGASQGMLMPTDTTTDFAEEKARQAALGAVGGVVGGAVVKGAGKALNPVVSAAEQRLTDLGVKLTPGQLIGSPARDLEAFASNVPYVGPSISAAKERAVESFNKGVVNKTLAKINDKLPENVTGRNAILYASDQVSNAYDDVLSKMNFDLNFKVSSDMLGALNKSSLPSEAQKMAAMDILNRTALSRFDKQTLTGAEYKLIESDLRKEASGYLNSTTQAEKQIGQALRNVLDVFKKELAVQNPKQTSNLRRIDAAYGDLEVIQTAAANSGAQNGIFTPKQYQTAVRQRDISRNKKSFARGTARGQDVSDAALDIMGESSTATLEGRLAAGATGVYGLLQNPAVAAGLAVTAPIMYSESGINAMNALMRSRPEIAQRIGKQLTDRATREGSITGAQVLEEYNRSLAPRIELNGMAR